ncbi:transcription factor APG isoform X1 [Setaria italica]|uniref:transcription factor APG isoform X1 n=1 Tax=Setaria italica TaxID=4555 RepID=UPI000648BB97|nr:transcription factor APG isoform X1 [Setaria italica]
MISGSNRLHLRTTISSSDDPFELVWGQGGGAGAPGSTTTMQPAAESCRLWSPPPEVPFDPPSEDEMAAWLCAIVKGEELVAFNAAGRDVPPVPKRSSGSSTTTTSGTKEKLPKTEVMGTKQEIRKPPAVRESSRSHHGEAHKLTEKRRRHKINERLRTLQQLVPGCDKSNQASTLDQTIQYMKSLQHHVQEMSGVGPARPAAVPVVPPQYAPPMAPVAVPTMMPAAPMVLAPVPTTMVPFGAMVQLPHYPAAVVPVMMPAAAAHLYPAAAPVRAAVAPGSAESSVTRRHGSSRSKGKCGSSLRKKH